MNDLIKARDAFRETADILDEIISLTERSEKGEDVKKELESAYGRFMFKMVELQNMSV